MRKLSEIKGKLAPGDKAFIADVTGYTRDMVYKIFSDSSNPNSSRNHLTKAGLAILEAADDLITFRERSRMKFRKKNMMNR